jgi:23S rRNA (guanosine2251-2'-O)-methyltransferase
MVDSSRRGRRQVMSNHNRCWIWGRHVVQETLRARRWPILELLVSDQLAGSVLADSARLAERADVAMNVVTDAALTKACRTEEHQGFAARMAPFPYLPFEQFVAKLPKKAFVAILDRLQDPFNFGAIARCASTLGVDGIIVGQREQVEINSQVARSSVGAVNYLPIAAVDSLVVAVEQLHDRGYQVVGGSEKADTPLFEADFSRSTALIIGNEGRGISADLLSRCDLLVSIPMSGRIGSLNAAVAAGIVFYEMRRQRSLSPGSR